MRNCSNLFLACAGLVTATLFSWMAARETRPVELDDGPLSCDEPLLDLGRVPWGDQQVVFSLRNEGRVPISVTQVRKSCGGCSTINVSSAALAPGGSEKVYCEWNTTGKRGSSGTDVTLVYRVGTSLTEYFCVLSLKGNVEPDFDWDQDELRFTGGKSDIATVHFRPVHMPNIRVLSAVSSHVAFEVTIANETSLEVHFHADRWKNDRGEFSIVVSTDNDKLPTCRLPVRVASPM